MSSNPQQRTVDARINAFTCYHCKDGTVFVPITLERIAYLEAYQVGMRVETKCHLGHTNVFVVEA